MPLIKLCGFITNLAYILSYELPPSREAIMLKTEDWIDLVCNNLQAGSIKLTPPSSHHHHPSPRITRWIFQTLSSLNLELDFIYI